MIDDLDLDSLELDGNSEMVGYRYMYEARMASRRRKCTCTTYVVSCLPRASNVVDLVPIQRRPTRTRTGIVSFRKNSL